MNLRSVGIYAAGAAIALTSVVPSHAQSKRTKQRTKSEPRVESSNWASHVDVEMIKGKLNSAEGKAGDVVVVRLQEDLKANGALVLKKGTTVTGVVRSVKRADKKAKSASDAVSMMQIEWFVPETKVSATQSVSLALHSIRQLQRVQQTQETQNSISPAAAAASKAFTATNRRSNPAMLSMPSVMPVDLRVGPTLEADLGSESSEQLFEVGHGQLVNSSGSRQSVDIFSHLNNDTLITAGGDFEISAGAEMQFLVGVHKN
jgi:uncharacterized Zn ribbon protein